MARANDSTAIAIDVDSMTATGKTLGAASTPPLPEPAATSRPSIDDAASAVRDAWRTDVLTADSAELGRRVSATVAESLWNMQHIIEGGRIIAPVTLAPGISPVIPPV